jgi:hypothetical protein
MARLKFGSYYAASATAGVDLIPLIKADIETKMNIKLSSPLVLKAIELTGDEDDEVLLNGFPAKLDASGKFAISTNDSGNLLSIYSIIPTSDMEIQIYYLR